jgi:dynein heavy chain
VLDALEVVRAKVRKLNEQLDEAKAKLKKVEDEAAALMTNLNLAERLVNGLSDEQVRWTSNVATFQEEKLTMIGNALLSAAFVSYIGPFLYTFRNRLWQEQWLPDITMKKIPISNGVDPLMILSSKSMHATWAQQDLPADRVSLENAAIIVSCSRYPLIIDPQLQGIRWIKGKEGAAM